MNRLAAPLFAFILLSSSSLVAEPTVIAKSTVASGGVLPVYLYGEGIEAFTVEIAASSGEILVTAAGFEAGSPVDPLGMGGVLWCALLGVPSTAAGEYRLVFRTWNGRDIEVVGRDLDILPGEYVRETIPLSTDMSDLRTSDDPRILREYALLRNILLTSRPGAYRDTGPFVLPLETPGPVSSRFGDRRTYRYADGGSDWSIHNGIDYAVPVGTPVTACADGDVVFEADRMLTGKTVVLEHLPGVFSLYYHLSSITVAEGRRVSAGETIGLSGSTGLVTGPHLHWEIRVAGVAVDPGTVIGRPLIDKSSILSMILLLDNQKGR